MSDQPSPPQPPLTNADKLIQRIQARQEAMQEAMQQQAAQAASDYEALTQKILDSIANGLEFSSVTEKWDKPQPDLSGQPKPSTPEGNAGQPASGPAKPAAPT